MNKEPHPMTFSKKMENIWYHYKYVILIGLAAFIMLAVALTQFLTKTSPDIFVYHVSREGLTAVSKENFMLSMELVAGTDYNGDGKVKVDLKEDIYTGDVVTASPNALNTTEAFNLELALGDCVVYIMDRSFYNGNRDYMMDLEEVLGYVPAYAFDEKAIKVCDLPAYNKLAGLKDFSENSYICLRSQRKGMDDEYYDRHVDFFKKLVAYGA